MPCRVLETFSWNKKGQGEAAQGRLYLVGYVQLDWQERVLGAFVWVLGRDGVAHRAPASVSVGQLQELPFLTS